MIDTHIHLEFESYDKDREQVLARFFSQGGKAIVTIGTDEKNFEQTLEIAENHENIFAAVGFHPQEGVDVFLKTQSLDFAEKIEALAQNQKVKAIGEIGLDYFHPSASDYELKATDQIKEMQKKLFVKQLELARKLSLPVIIHCWDAHADCWEIIQHYSDLKMVFHCYGRGIGLDYTEKLLQSGNIWFSFTGNVTFARPGKAGSEIFDHLRLIPLEKIMVETDGPFLAPVPFRGKRNEPAYVRQVIEKIAEVKGLSVEKVEKATDENAKSFFSL